MEEKKIWGLDFNTLLILGWIAPLVLNVAGVVLAIILALYFKNEKKVDFLAEGFRQIANVNISIFIAAIGLGVSMSIFFIIPVVGIIVGAILGLVLLVIAVYELFVTIMGAIEASKGNIYKAKYQIEFLK